jgi:mevalonate kinase
MQFIASAPAKIILTGEHSVVYGEPAIVTAVNRFAYAEIAPALSADICLNLFDFKQKASSTLRALRILRERLLESYHLCLNGKLSIREVLQKPSELFQFALISFIDTFQMELQKGFHLNIRSDIPIGCGMGSSAATIVSVIGALAHFFKFEVKTEWLHRLSQEAERLQHGHSSGVDSYVSLNGGCVRFQKGQAKHLNLPTLPIYIVNSGKPVTSTGECVMQVAKAFRQSTIWNEFGALAKSIEEALNQESNQTQIDKLKELIRFNHKLLVTLGVVPKKVCDFIQAVECTGGAAKICGAGAVAGDASGVVMVVADSAPQTLCDQFGYSLIEARGETQGVRIVS